ncbi:MAG: hypothetical protein GC191_08925 [Azospirillum sp.]|nr:hypothetical protein [Azospirillum sp.]
MNPIRAYLKESRKSWADLAQDLNVSVHTIKKWGSARQVPAKAVPALVAVSRGKLSPAALRADLYQPETVAAIPPTSSA